MRTTIKDFGTGWFDVAISLDSGDIDKLIDFLVILKEDPNYHFHLYSTAFDKQKGGVSDIQFFRAPDKEETNMDIGA